MSIVKLLTYAACLAVVNPNVVAAEFSTAGKASLISIRVENGLIVEQRDYADYGPFIQADENSLAELPGDKISSATNAGWFYMVKSRPSEPAREAEYNTWYEDIDIPDVLAVPGFMRARRAIARESTEVLPTDASYAAFYDIDTVDIDKSIIDLYVAARKMSQLGRLTNVLKVVEANYYQLLSVGERRGQPETTDGITYVFTQKILCCDDPSARSEFLHWYGAVLEPALIESWKLWH